MGKKYRRDPVTGYYICTTGDRKRLHVVVWEQTWGCKVPPGCVIHHLDWNKANNTPENLICVTIGEHERIHNIIGGDEGKKLGYKLVGTRVNGMPPCEIINIDKSSDDVVQ